MKKTFLKKRFWVLFFALCFVVGANSCKKDFEDIDHAGEKHGGQLSFALNLSYDIETTKIYQNDEKTDYSPMDLAAMTPMRNKQNVLMKITHDSDVFMEITKQRDKYEIDIPHETPPEQTKQIHKTVIRNKRASFYDKSGNLITSLPVEIPNQYELVRTIRDAAKTYSIEKINRAIATLQSDVFINELKMFIKEAPSKGIKVVDEDKKYITLRTAFPKQTEVPKKEAVIIINKKYNRLAACKVYENNKAVLTTYLGYAKKKYPYLNAIKQLQTERLPSGQNIVSQSITKIENIDFKLSV
ncbi:MAG: hypothetical protein ACOCUV_01840 [bacterium]